MKETKTELRFFTIADWEEEQTYLTNQHKNGWRFTGLSLLCLYHFERCTPEAVVYQLDYCGEKGSGKETYVQMFTDCGWEYLSDHAGYSYFRKPVSAMQGEEEIFSDEDSKRDMLFRVAKGRLVPLAVILFCIIIPNLFLQFIAGNLGMGCLFLALFVLYLFVFIRLGAKFKQHR